MSQLIMRDITKGFDNIPVLKKVNFTVNAGDVHALMGVNGAGKSTLMKILSGHIPLDRGQIIISDQEVHIDSPKLAKEIGIGMVVQEVDTGLVPSLTVAENLCISHLLDQSTWRPVTQRQIFAEAERRLNQVDLKINLKKRVDTCSVSEKQLILIARAVAENAKYLILDEPTASLSQTETEKLFKIIKTLKQKGVGIIFISHRMPEIKAICDQVTVLRDGKNVKTAPVANISIEEIIKEMLGEFQGALEDRTGSRQVKDTTPLLSIKDLYVPETKKHLNLTVNRGEIVGIAGLVGAGKSETAKALVGGTSGVSGTWSIRNKTYKIKKPSDAIQAGICLIPEERRKQGLVTGGTILENLSLPSLNRFVRSGFILANKEKEAVSQTVKDVGIKTPALKTEAKKLSGGNQQKVVIGKWLMTDCDVFILDEPTKGIDVQAKQDIFTLINNLANQGKSMLYFTSEIEELLQIADRILVMFDGEFVASFNAKTATHGDILKAATGGVQLES
jgi:simple sugar transport system ATP-binding protein